MAITGLATTDAATMFLWLQLGNGMHKRRMALTITGILTVLAFYHYVCIFNFWVEAFSMVGDRNGDYMLNDAYHHVNWLLLVPRLLIELSSWAF